MAIFGDLRVSATLGSSYRKHSLRSSISPPPSKVELIHFLNGGSGASQSANRWRGNMLDSRRMHRHSKPVSGTTGDYQLFSSSLPQQAESFLINASNMSFIQRLNLAWKIIFRSPTTRNSSNANIAKQRLKMILYSDRCAVSDEAKQKIVNNIVHALSEFVEIESQDKVQLSVTTDSDLGTVYSVSVPVRRVKPQYRDSEEFGSIMNIEYKDTGETCGCVDVRFDFYVPDDRIRDF